MGLDLIYNDGQTQLDEDEKEGLLIKSIATSEYSADSEPVIPLIVSHFI